MERNILMIKSILAGMMIGTGGIIYLNSPNKVAGAILFAVGLLTILFYKWNLFTGKAGLLATNGIKPLKLLSIWGGNAIGCAIVGLMIRFSNSAIPLAAKNIIDIRMGNPLWANLILGIFCGILMYIAVANYAKLPWVTVMCVAAFILAGFNHCVADMFFCAAGATFETILPMTASIIATSCGNIIGCNLIPLLRAD